MLAANIIAKSARQKSMLNACPEEPQLSHILRTGEPLEVKYPERDDVEVVEVDINEIRRNEDESG